MFEDLAWLFWPGISVVMIAASTITVFGLANYYMKATLDRASKNTAIATLLNQYGIKDVKVTDLNANKLDDKGFNRLMLMLQHVANLKNQTAAPAGMSKLQRDYNDFINMFNRQQPQQTQQQQQPPIQRPQEIGV